MKLTDVQVDGFGVWSGLTLNNLSPHCTVFYGPNEAGKSTLLQFLRGVLYGFSPQRRLRYLPPLRGGTAGGTLSITVPDEGRVEIQRRETADYPLGGVSIEAADGAVQGESHLRRLLHDIDEVTYNNVFAVGLRELQELGTLTDIDAARWLYALTSGMDRVSLFDVQQELERSRLRLLPAAGASAGLNGGERPSQVGDLLLERDRLRRELADLAGLSQRHGQLVNDRTACEQELSQVARELATQEAEHGTLKAAVAAYDAWQRRELLDGQLRVIALRDPWPADTVPRMNHILSAIRQSRRRVRRLGLRQKQLGQEWGQIALNEALCRQGARIEALAEHESWILSAEQQLRSAEATAKALTDEQQTQLARLPHAAPQISSLPRQLDEHAWGALRHPAAVLMKARRRFAAIDGKIKQQQSAAQSGRQQLETVLAPRKERDLTASIDAAGQRVSQLRRRIQLDERIDQLAKTQGDLEHHAAILTQEQVMSPRIVIAVGSVFVLGVVLLLSGLVLPGSFTGAWGWPLAWLGLFGTGLAIASKLTLEKSAAAQLDACQKQLALTQTQAKEAAAERDTLDRALPSGGGPLPQRLQTAEQELARLEQLLPLEAQRHTAEQSAVQIEQQGSEIKHRYHQALRRWREALAAVGLPDTLTPPQVRDLSTVGIQLSALARRLAEAQADVDRHRRELTALAGRIEQTYLAAGLEMPLTVSLSEQLRHLRRELAEQESRQQHREALRLRRQKLRRRHKAIAHQLRKWRRRRQRLLTQCHVGDLVEFRTRAADFAKLASLAAQRDATAAEIISLLAGVATETVIGEIVTHKNRQQLEDQLAIVARQVDDSRHRQQRLFEQRGQLSEQIRLVGGDRRMAVKRFELAQVEQRLSNAVQRWQVLTVTSRLLEWIKHDYQRNRQPETLRQASEYLVRLTEGHYRRVWTPLGENILLVEDHEGRSLGIDVLSRGTREQLFLSLRLALVALFARRGAPLPMILDDVLVNFDGHRAIAAVGILHDFAAQGHQLLVFTCHEHVAQLFKSQRIDVRRLPSNAQAGHDLPFSIREELPPRRSRPRRTKEESPTVEHAIVESPPTMASTVIETATQPGGPETQLLEDQETSRRIDPPQNGLRSALRRRSVNESSVTSNGHVDRLWLVDGNVWMESPEFSSPLATETEENEAEEAAEPDFDGAARLKKLKILDQHGSPIVVELPPHDDDTLA